MKKTLSIIIPAYNEKDTILQVIDLVKKVNIGDYNKEIIVVDDGSKDGTRELLAKATGVKKVFQPKNTGKGGALKEGIRQATGDYIIFHDADMEYDPADFKYMLPLLESGLVDVVIGSRFTGRKQVVFGKNKNVVLSNLLGNMVLRTAFNILYMTRFSDIYPCYKMIRLADLKALELKERGFAFDLEMIIKLLKKGKVFVDVPVHYSHRGYHQGKKIRPLRDGIRSLAAILKYRVFN